MRLVRVATVQFTGVPCGQAPTRLSLGDTNVDVIIQKPGDNSVLQCVAASRQLERIPKKTNAGLLVVSERDRKLLEDAISHFAHLISISQGWPFSVASAFPSVAFIPEDDDDRNLLDGSVGIHFAPGNRGFPRTNYTIPLTDLSIFSDRLDGVALLAQSVNSARASSAFMTHIRIFERAFGKPVQLLTESLADFLAGAKLGYELSEIDEWVKLRHGVSHADVKYKPIVLDVDVSWLVGRTEQAAYDVFANKTEWSSPQIARRHTWRPICGTTDREGGLLATRGHAFQATMTLFDEFRRFPMNLNGVLTGLPEGWWAGRRQSEGHAGSAAT